MTAPRYFSLAAIARIFALWIAAGAVYAVWFTADWSITWLAVDVALVAALGYVARPSRTWLAIAGACVALLVFSGVLVADRNGIWLDEGEYLRTLHHGFIVRDGVLPFDIRWLEPVIAGPLDLFPARGDLALKACNFAALAVAVTELCLLLGRLGVERRVARLAPLFFVCSYLGVYAASNRLVIDPFNYALFVLVLHSLVPAAELGATRWLLLIAACNSEKVIYWIPIVFAIQLLDAQGVKRALVTTLRVAAPTLIYLVAVFLYTLGSTHVDSGPFFEQLDRLALTSLGIKIEDPVAIATTPQMLWFPFGALTIYTLLALPRLPRWLAALPLLLIPIVAQVLLATDAQRMVACAFIVYIPIGCLYLSEVIRATPRWGLVAVVATGVLVVCQHYLLPLGNLLNRNGVHFMRPLLHHHAELRRVLELCELALAGAIVWIHAVIARRGRSHEP